MERTHHATNTLRPPQFFIPTPTRQLRCLLYGTTGLTLSKAHQHEDTNIHVQRVQREARRSLEVEGTMVEGTDPTVSLPSQEELHWPLYNNIWTTAPSRPSDAIYDDYGGDLSLLGGEPVPDDAPVATEALRSRSPAFEDPFNLKGELGSQEPAYTYSDKPVPPIMPPPPDPEGWLPWTNEPDRLLTALSGFPRALYSQPGLEVLTWFSERLGISGLSSPDQLKTLRNRISDTFGSNPQLATSSLGNIFSHNSLKAVISHELANPITTTKLSVFPEGAGPHVTNPSHGAKWREEVEGSLASPMARLHGPNGSYRDVFVNEPSLVKIDGQVAPVLVTRWFTRQKALVANVHRLIPVSDPSGYAVDGSVCLEIAQQDFHLALPDFRRVHGEYGLSSLDSVFAIWPDGNADNAVPWKEPTESPWRARAKGKEVIFVPILRYYDDTSGNSSKKWNKHNSYLFVLAGLPREDIQSPYHVHFLATSNIASPLEMLEAIVQESEEAAREGIWAYSAIKRDLVLAVAWWLALEGDNPMHERQVRGKDKERPDGLEGEKQRLHELMTIAPLRSRNDTVAGLTTQLDEFMAKRFTTSDNLPTETGIEDKYLGHFIGIMKESYNNKTSSGHLTAKQGRDLLANLRSQLPQRLFNPALYLPGIDVTQDTPVEVLHVVSLGVVKYFWRDAVSRQDSSHRAIIIARLNSFNTSGLGISRLSGKTLVQYAKSLTGGNFRDILQVAPAVLYDLLETRVYNMWVALCHLAPLVFQPEIHNIDAYTAELEARIDALLMATVMCNPQWFNKPQFHVLIHLPSHVRRFGPPILFATETFESYNFVTRLRSIHSNRQAPSADIGASFSLMRAIRHLVSGGYFQLPDPPANIPSSSAPWIQTGPKVQALRYDKTFVKFMGLSSLSDTDSTGLCTPLSSAHGAPVTERRPAA
ncbi:hypothetical protein BDV93DRAFT_595834 [Ceratobasidium sp. AG-I]|nr:hypothetical protein BDV93DRAFT_595834 [Ceratobasidium sp. AG-I]